MNDFIETLASLTPKKLARLAARLPPLSFSQQRLWFLHRLEPNNTSYNSPAAVRLVGRLDADALGRTFDEIVRRHESLRTTFMVIGSKPVQIISPPAPVSLPLEDLSWLPAGEREDEARRLALDEAARPFDLLRGPLLRVRLLRLAEEEHVVLLTMHHIVSDGWSIGVLVNEVGALYEAFSRGEESPLPELPIQYSDYAVWQRERLQGEALETQTRYWREQLGGELPVLELPTDRPRPAVQSFRGAQYHFTLPEEAGERLRELGRREGATLFMVLLAAFKVLLYRHTGQTDVLVGTAIVGRDRAEFAHLIGFFVNTLVLRTDVSGDPSFAEVVRRVRETCLGAYAHQDVPFEKLVEELQPTRSMAHAPLFQVFFAMQNASQPSLRLSQLEVSAVEMPSATVKFDLNLTVTEREGEWGATWEYGTDLFDEATIGRLAERFRILVAAAAADPSRPVSRLPLLPADERRLLLAAYNDTARDYPRDLCVQQLFELQAGRTPDATALVYEDEEISYAELDRRAERLARSLRALGVGPERRVGVCAARTPRLLVALLAVWKAGGAYVPLDPAYPQERLRFMLEDAGAELLLTERPLLTLLPGQSRVLCLEDADGDGVTEGGASEPPPGLTPSVTPANLAYLIYTSGSTGRPKGVCIEHRSAAAFLHWAAASFPAEQWRGVLASTSVCFDLSIFELFGPLACGGAVVLADDALALPRLKARERVTLVNTVPSAMAELCRGGGLPASVRAVNLAGEALRRALVEEVYESGAGVEAVNNLYGPTEDTTYTTWTRVGRGEAGEPGIGRPVWGTRIYILDGRGELAPAGAWGELYIGGEGLARGYHARPGQTAERFVPDAHSGQAGARLYRTGDVARWRTGGELEYAGRADHQVKVRGFRIELGEVEAALLSHDDVRECVVVAHGEGAARRLAAYYAGGESVGGAELRAHLRARLPEYMVPGAWVRVEELPRTANGKIDRKALPEPDGGNVVRSAEYVAPRTMTEELMAAVWSEVLGVEQVGVNDDFFELGGHSLLGTVLFLKVQEKFNCELELRRLFDSPTVAALSRCVEERLAVTSGQPPASTITPVPRGTQLPLSFAQQRLWFIDQLEPGSNLYNVPLAIRLAGRLDLDALGRTFTEIISRHEVLRTSFPTVGGRPVQHISPPAAVTPPVEDLSALPAGGRQERAQRLAREEASRPFDLARGPLFRVRLLRLAEEEHVCLLTMHHIVSDGWSLEVLGREVGALYDAFTRGAGSPLPELPIQYADYAVWQREWLQGEVLERQMRYWREQLGGELPVLELPADRPRPPVLSYNGGQHRFTLPAEVTGRLRELAAREGATLFMVLLAAFKVLLSRYTGQTDVVVGTDIAGRNRAEVEGLIGFFVNQLVLRTDVTGEPTFVDVVRRVREVCLGAYAHQDVPFEMLVEELAPERSLVHAPLFQVKMLWQNAPRERPSAGGPVASAHDAGEAPARVDLTLMMADHGTSLSATWVYSTDLFDPATLARMTSHFVTLLEAAAADSSREVWRLPLLADDERRLLVSEFNAPTTHYPPAPCLHELFERQVERTPAAAAVVYEGEAVTYAELNVRANRLAHHLRALGVGPESLVGLCVGRSVEMVVGLLGILKAGGAYVPLDPDYPQERLQFMLEDAGVGLLVTQEALLARLPPHGAHLLCLDRDAALIASHADSNPVAMAGEESLAYVIYTSGSTGRPKGALITHRNVTRLFTGTRRLFDFCESDVWTMFHSFAFDFSVWEIWGALLHGGRLVVVPEWVARSPEEFYRLLVEERVTILNQTPSAFRQLMRAEAEAGGDAPGLALREIIFGGEALEVNSLLPWMARHGAERPHLVNMYGITETTVHVTYRRLSARDAGRIKGSPIGRPLDDLEVYVLDAHGELSPVGVAGELYVGGDGVGRGYLNREELTRERFVAHRFGGRDGERLYRTGDVGRWLAEGELEYLGRADEQVKVRGYRIELGEVEAVLNQHRGVRESVVLAEEEGDGGRRLVAYVVGGEAGLDVGELREFLRGAVPEYMVPSAIVVLDELPLTPNGKLDRRALPAPASISAAGPDSAPRTETEVLTAQVFADVLGVAGVGIADDFFELGGHSLLATRLVSRVREVFGVELRLREVFGRRTVREVSRGVEELLREGLGSGGAIARAERVGDGVPLSFAQQRLWFINQLEPDQTAYNIPLAVRLKGDLNVEALEQTLSALVARHESLRTSFPIRDGQPVQIISPPAPVALPVEDLSPLSAGEREEAGQRLAREEAARPFDLLRGPLLRVRLLRLAEDEHVCLLTMHHIVSDGWSIGVLVRELGALYEAFSRGADSPLPELPIQYADYAVWQREWLTGDVLERQLAYWRKQLAGASGVLELPSDRPRPAVQSYRSASHAVDLHGGVGQGLTALSQQAGVTLFMTLLAAFQTLLMRYTGQEDIIVGSPIAGRTRAETEGLIGLFLNTLLLRTDMSGNPTFRELLGRVREVALGAYAHQDVPFEKLVEELQPERDLSRGVLFQVMFILQNAPSSPLELPGLVLSPINTEAGVVRSDLDFYLWELSEGLEGRLVYNADLFDASTVARMSRRFRVLAESIVRNPDVALADLQIEEEHRLPDIEPCITEEERVPLSYHQERLWFIDEFETGNVYESSPVYHNIPLILHLSGRLDADALEASLNLLVERHAALRTGVVTESDRGLQVVSPDENIKLKVFDLAGADERVSVDGAVERALEEARQPFVMGRDLLVRAALFRMSREESVLVVTVHHIVADKRSLQIIAEELQEAYGARTAGRAPRLPTLPLQFTDYTRWQRGLSGETLEPLTFYWKWQLRGKLQALELPEDRPRPAVHTYTAARHTFTLGENLAQRIRDLGREEDAGAFAVALAGFKALLRRYARQDEIVVGTSEPCRNQPGTQGMVGPLANLLTLRSNLAGNPTFRTLLARVTKTVEAARAHQEMPFDKLVQELNPAKDMSRTALFDVLFQFEEAEPPALELGEVKARVIDTNLGYGKYDLNLSVRPDGGALSGTVVYNADIYDGFTIRQMMRHFEAMLDAVTSAPDEHIDDVALLREAEEHQQLVVWNSTQASYPEGRTVHQLFEKQVRRTPDNTAVVCGDATLTYRELDGRANRLAHHLRRQGVEPDTLVALCLNKSADMVVALLAVLKAGGAYLPLDPAYPEERLRFMVEDSGVSHLITTKPLSSRVSEKLASLTLLDADGESIAAQPSSTPRHNTAPGNLAYCIYTSGSTGKPKGVLLEHRNVVRLMLNDRLPFTFTETDVWTMFHSYCFDFTIWEMYGALLYGGKLVIVPEAVMKDPSRFLDLVVGEKVTVLNQTPTAFYNLAKEALGRPHTDLSLRYVIFGGEALHPIQLREWRQAYPTVRLVNMYGITETTVHVTFKEITDREIEANVSNIGSPIPTTTAYIMDPNLRLLPVGVPGEVCVGGGGVGRGYLGRDELTRQKFVSNPYRPEERLYRSGDLAKLLPSGEILYLGRFDDQVQVRGFRVELGEVQSHLLEHPLVSEAEVIARQTPNGTTELVAYVVPSAEVTVTALRNHLAETLAFYMVPAAFVMLKALPLTPNGKIDRRALPAPNQMRPELERRYLAPRTRVEETLAAIWAEVLDVEQVGVYDNFFELGGDSIRSIQVVSRSQSQGLAFSIQHLFQHPTVGELAQHLGGQLSGERSGGLTAPFALISEDDRRKLPDGVEDAYPLVMLQAGMIFHSELSPETAMYHDIMSYELRAPLDLEVIRAAAREMFRRHAVLRTSFDLTSYSEPLQLVHTEVELPLTVGDMTDLDEAGREEAVRLVIEEEKRHPFDWRRAPLMRARLHRRGAEAFQFTLSFHHILLDGWSVASLLTEMFQHYAFLLGKADRDIEPAPELAFREFVRLEREALAAPEPGQYWRLRLEGSDPTRLHRWPFERDEAADHAAHHRGVPVSAEVTAKLKQLASEEGVPFKTVMLAAHLKVVSLLSGRRDVVTGLVSHGRPEHAEGERVLGLFLNTLPLRVGLGGGTWRDLIRETFDAERSMLPFRRYPVARIQQEQNGRALFETLFNYTHFHVMGGMLDTGGLETVSRRAFGKTNLPFIANFNVDALSSRVNLTLSGDAKEFGGEQMQAMRGYYAAVLDAMAEAPSESHEREFAPLLDETEVAAAAKSYWLGLFAAPPPPSALDPDFLLPAPRTAHEPRFAAVACRVSAERLDRLGIACGVSRASLLLGLFAALLSRLSGREEVVIAARADGGPVLPLRLRPSWGRGANELAVEAARALERGAAAGQVGLELVAGLRWGGEGLRVEVAFVSEVGGSGVSAFAEVAEEVKRRVSGESVLVGLASAGEALQVVYEEGRVSAERAAGLARHLERMLERAEAEGEGAPLTWGEGEPGAAGGGSGALEELAADSFNF